MIRPTLSRPLSLTLSIRARIVLILLFLGLGGELAKIGFDGLRITPQVAQESERSIRIALYRIDGLLERFLSEGRRDDAQWMLSMLSVRDEEVQAAILDPQGAVIAASRREQIGQSWQEVRDAYGLSGWTISGTALHPPPGQTPPPKSGVVQIIPGPGTISGVTPVCILTRDGLRTPLCYTYIQTETTTARHDVLRNSLIREATMRMGAVIILAALLWLTLGTSVVRRAGLIVTAASAFRQGDLMARSNVRGEDEPGRIGEALDGALERLGAMMHQTINAFSTSTQHTDPYTAGHESRVADLCVLLGREMGLTRSQLEGLEIAARAHDIGQARIPSEILLSPRKLGPLEFAFIRQHPDVGAEILGGIDFPWPVAEIVRQHHENYDGSGYPQGLRGSAILIEARILRVADMLESLSSHRPFRPAMPWVEALEIIRTQGGKALDPDVVNACLRVVTVNGYRFPSLSAAPEKRAQPQPVPLPDLLPQTMVPPSRGLPPVTTPGGGPGVGPGAGTGAGAGPEPALHRAMRQTIEALSAALESRDPYTAGHERQVAAIAVAIATRMGLDPFRIEGLRLAATVHDIGKIQIPLRILAKPGRLSEIEFNLIKTHPTVGYDILRTLDLPWPVADMVYQHHEYLDGSGYPCGLTGDEIMLEARIMTVADIVESMSSPRPYRPSLGLQAALAEIRRMRGQKLDPAVVDACLALYEEAGVPAHGGILPTH